MQRPARRVGFVARPRSLAAALAIAAAAALLASGCVVNGTWTPLTLAAPTPSAVVEVSCVSVSWCLTLGDGAQVWNGTTLTTRPAPSVAFGGDIEALDCFAVDRCAAIEQRFDSWLDATFHLLLFDGTSWTEPPGLDDLGDGNPNLLSCGIDGCVVLDTWDRVITWDGVAVSVEQFGLIPVWNLDCVAMDDCLALGAGDTYRYDGSDFTPLAFEGPDGNEGSTFLDCPTSTDRCVAVGFRSNVERVSEAMVWDGATWTETTLPTGVNTWFTGLSCVASLECVATGGAFTSGTTSGTAAVLTFNGADWYAAPTPPGGAGAVYQDVSCVTQTCIAVGVGTPPAGGPTGGIASRYHWTYP